MSKMACHITDGPETPEDVVFYREDDENYDRIPPMSSNPLIIGLTGRAGCGKDTVGNLLREQHDFATTSFALPIKQAICAMLGVTLDKWNDRVWRETVLEGWDHTPRQLAQTIGTEWGRDTIKDSLWLDLALLRIETIAWPLFAITDVRFDNEATKIRSAGGYIVHVHRVDIEGISTAHHRSEVGITAYDRDFHINNFGTLAELNSQVKELVSRILELSNEKV